jgi:L-alanine-DL-glutamate epimerase-like enolase superfamily enzyme
MKITEVRLAILEDPEHHSGHFRLRRVPGLRRTQYTHGSQMVPDERPLRQAFLRVGTDEGVEGMCTTTMTPEQVAILRTQVLGQDPLAREHLYQLLHKGTRWVYQRPGWFGDFDNCLWDLLGQLTGRPVYDLVGRVRERFPVYLTSGDAALEEYLRVIELGRAHGVQAYKFHTYKGGRADIPILREVRRVVGPDYLLLNDPVCSYDLAEAIEVGHVMEELGFLWLEEPMHEQKQHRYQQLCRELTIPVMSNETLMHDIGLSTQWLLSGATDLLRANARHGTTQVLKMAHFAEMYDTNVEMNAEGGLFGLVHAHLGCCIDNTGFYEAGPQALAGDHGATWGMTNTPAIVDGHIAPPDGPGWGAEWDWDRFAALTVEEH